MSCETVLHLLRSITGRGLFGCCGCLGHFWGTMRLKTSRHSLPKLSNALMASGIVNAPIIMPYILENIGLGEFALVPRIDSVTFKHKSVGGTSFSLHAL